METQSEWVHFSCFNHSPYKQKLDKPPVTSPAGFMISAFEASFNLVTLCVMLQMGGSSKPRSPPQFSHKLAILVWLAQPMLTNDANSYFKIHSEKICPNILISKVTTETTSEKNAARAETWISTGANPWLSLGQARASNWRRPVSHKQSDCRSHQASRFSSGSPGFRCCLLVVQLVSLDGSRNDPRQKCSTKGLSWTQRQKLMSQRLSSWCPLVSHGQQL